MVGGKHVEDKAEEELSGEVEDPQDWTLEVEKEVLDEEDWKPEDVCAPEHYNTD